MKALCDQQGVGHRVAIDDLPQEEMEKISKEIRARRLDNDDVLPEHKATAEKMDLLLIKRAKDPNFLYAKTHSTAAR